MTGPEIISAVRQIAIELSCRGSRPGEIEPGTRDRYSAIRRPLVDWFNQELNRTVETYAVNIDDADQKRTQPRRRATVAGVVIKAIISHGTRVFARGDHLRRWTPQETEQAIVAAATALPLLCDRLEAIVAPASVVGEAKDEGETQEADADTAVDGLTTRQRKIVEFLMGRKHFTAAETMKEIPGAFKYGVDSEDRAVTAAVDRINRTWLDHSFHWTITVKDAKGSPRFKLER